MNANYNQPKLTAYIDESGRHDKSGKQPGSGQIIVAGWLDWSDNWPGFCQRWQTILEKYQAPYFHFTEWADASAVIRKKREPSSSLLENPYRNWDLNKLDNFLYELADLAGSGDKLNVGIWLPTRVFAETTKVFPKNPFKSNDPYRQCLYTFFEVFIQDVEAQWRYWQEPVAFYFDQNDDDDWTNAVSDAFSEAKKGDVRIGELKFVCKTNHLAIQAADMVVYRLRQLLEKMLNPKESFPKLSKLDDRLIKPAHLRSSPDYKIKTLFDANNIQYIRSMKGVGPND
ncbi:MAG TPA: DUF3800 domain-containing protein [Candidatus Sulfotelmatobacter sp.]|jgi:hypothetical protein|nr:DUF3800 domain-containing protein [Candidatus Sulfotelmatobacter sp.]